MSAVSNLTYIWIQDAVPGSPEKDTSPIAFSNYNEAMSFAKWVSINERIQSVYVYLWNYNGGSGFWSGGVFNPRPNENWPA